MTGDNTTLLRKSFRATFPLILISTIAGVILSILAPYGTGRLPLFWRMIYWIGLCIAGGLGTLFYTGLQKKFQWSETLWLTALGQSIGATAGVSVFIFGLAGQFTWIGTFITLFNIWVVGIVICGIGVLLNKNANVSETQEKTAQLYERLPPKFRSADIYAITSEDHYVRVYTSLGEEMILMRLSDAVKEAEPLLGIQTHRSWWIAEKGVEAVSRKDGKMQVTLKNGVIAPVSRNGAKAVKSANWI